MQPQSTRRSHLERDARARVQAALAAATSGSPPQPAAPSLPPLEPPSEEPSLARFPTIPPPPRPPSPPPPAHYPGTFRSIELQIEQDIVEAAPPNDSEPHSIPDDWEYASDADSPPVPAIPPDPPLPPPAPSAPLPPAASGVPPEKQQENTPDPFLSHSTTHIPPLPPSPDDVHPEKGVYLLYMLVVWLHAQFHLPFKACTVVVNVVLLIVAAFSRYVEPPPVTTLPRILARLDVEPLFDIHPVCSKCLEVYPAGYRQANACAKCLSPIFKQALMPFRKPIPLLQFPHLSLQAQLSAILAVPGVEEHLDAWRAKARFHGRYSDIFDGRIAKSVPAPDGTPFFQNRKEDMRGPSGELRIGLTLGVDWFSYLRSQIAPSHTSCPISLSIANLPPHLRYCTSNLLLFGIMPGPKEQNPDQCQRFLRILVNELLRLWKDGFTAATPSRLAGRLVRVILLCICCDKPAAHKMGGFGSHSHTFFCTRCWIQQADKAGPRAFDPNGFQKRTDKQQRDYGERYAKLGTSTAQEEFARLHATRWSEFARLPYFDMVRMVVIDPMHNLLLGLVKTHFYHIWVQTKILRKTKELSALHQIIADFSIPSYMGRLPALIGEPAGGSLTADQWMLLATVVGPVAIPEIWNTFIQDPDAARQHREAAIKARVEKKARDAQAKKQKAAERAAAKKASQQPASTQLPTQLPLPPAAPPAPPPGGDDDDEPPASLHPDDPANFLKLSRALRLLLRHELADYELDEAESLLQDYCTELLTLYGPDVIRPNHHYCIHTADCARDFGPLHEFWTFIFERLNKVLKSFNTNNHGGGELETTFFREFHRTVAVSRLVARASQSDVSGLFKLATDAMFQASADDRGTVQALAKEIDEAQIDGDVQYRLSARSQLGYIPSAIYHSLLGYLARVFPETPLRALTDPSPAAQSIGLPDQAHYFDYAVVNSRRYHASGRSSSKANSLVQAFISPHGSTWVGELVDIIQVVIPQTGQVFVVGNFDWFFPLDINLLGTPWESYASSDIQLWYPKTANIPQAAQRPTPFLPLHFIKCHVATHSAIVAGMAALVTMPVKN